MFPSCAHPARAATVVATAIVLGACATRPAEAPGFAVVVDVVDGDTIDVRIGGRDERVRLIGVDTPETKRPDTPVECFGPEATAFTESLLPPGTAVRLERDVVGRDDYGRLLAYVHRIDTDADGDTDTATDTATDTDTDGDAGTGDGVFVNDELVRRGYARPLTIPPNVTFAEQFVDAARDAERADAGLWSACR